MKSSITFDIDEKNVPVVLAAIGESSDVRDKIANRFLDNALKGESEGFCKISYKGVDHQNRTVLEISSSERLYSQKDVVKLLNKAKGNPLFGSLTAEDFLKEVTKK